MKLLTPEVKKQLREERYEEPKDPMRIGRVLLSVERYWKKHPELRLTQLLYILLNGKHKNGNDLFYVEDNLIEDLLEQND